MCLRVSSFLHLPFQIQNYSKLQKKTKYTLLFLRTRVLFIPCSLSALKCWSCRKIHHTDSTIETPLTIQFHHWTTIHHSIPPLKHHWPYNSTIATPFTIQTLLLKHHSPYNSTIETPIHHTDTTIKTPFTIQFHHWNTIHHTDSTIETPFTIIHHHWNTIHHTEYTIGKPLKSWIRACTIQ